jgi:CDP-glycerol glycerophosphotransferase (TagB/SpsB family)
MLKNHIDDGYDYCFGIDKNGRGYDKVSDLRNIVDYSSDDYKIKFLAADLIISSQWSDWVYNAFGEDRDYMKDLYGFKFVFLQHGIIRNDMSERGHKLKKNISLFITSTRREWDDVKSGSYGYNDDQVKLTGMPRYDSLENEPKKIVSFMPTWRYYVNITTTSGKSNREYSDVFKETGYYKFYNKLINDHRILSKMSEKGYKGNFYVHPLMEAQYVDFHGNDVISVAKGTADYNRAFKETSLMVTDYSSIDADYSIMKKPLIYCQFDKELFFSTHTYVEGYFDYAKDGFGPVRYDYESSVDTILEYLENDCKEEPEYAKRVDDFFQFTDRHNCERVLSEIRKLLG